MNKGISSISMKNSVNIQTMTRPESLNICFM
jgi:hypothetical protein